MLGKRAPLSSAPETSNLLISEPAIFAGFQAIVENLEPLKTLTWKEDTIKQTTLEAAEILKGVYQGVGMMRDAIVKFSETRVKHPVDFSKLNEGYIPTVQKY